MPLSLRSISLVAGGIALLFLLGLTLFWRIPDSPARRWLLLFGLAALPGLALLLGTQAALEGAKRPEFCGSCHVMDPFENDMRDPASPTLASAHFQNRYILENTCYTCHTEYTFFGPLRAKVAGMRHIWKYETRGYTLPIRLRTPYNFGTCRHCHAEARVFREKHPEELRQILEKGEATCLDCHAPVHPGPETRS